MDTNYKITGTLKDPTKHFWIRGEEILVIREGQEMNTITLQVPRLDNLFTEVLKAEQFSEIKIVRENNLVD